MFEKRQWKNYTQVVRDCDDIKGEWIEVDSKTKISYFLNAARFTISDQLYFMNAMGDTMDVLSCFCDSSRVVKVGEITIGKPNTKEMEIGHLGSDIWGGAYYYLNDYGILELTDALDYAWGKDTIIRVKLYLRLDRSND
jgi:hypothetical protein